MESTLQKYTCDRCGFDYKKSQLKRQRGMLLCEGCKDNLKKIKIPNPRWMSPRDGSTSTSPVNIPTVFTISAAAGITSLGQSREYTHEGSRRIFHMYVVSDGGAIDITANPQIVAGLQGDVLCLHGTSNTDTIKLDDADGLLANQDKEFILTDGDTITFVYNTFSGNPYGEWGTDDWGLDWGGVTTGWVETSRYKGGI